MTDKTPEQIAAGLTDWERKRLLGWQGTGGAAFNATSERLCKAGLLNSDWTLAPLGLAVREILRMQFEQATESPTSPHP